MADDTPPFGLDIIHPEIVERLISIPAPKEVNVAIVGIDTHGVATAFRGCVAIGVDAVQTPPLGVWLTGLEVGLEEAGRGGVYKESLGLVPVSLEHEGGVQRCHDGMLELDVRTGEDRLVRRQEPPFTEVLENLA